MDNTEISKNDTAAQDFALAYEASTGYYFISQASTGLCVDVKWGSTASGTDVWLWTANWTNAQRWAIAANADGTYTMRNAITGFAIDAQWGGTTDGTNIWVYEYNGTAAQKWAFTKK